MVVFSNVLYGLAGSLFLVSLFKDRKKTKMALKKTWKTFMNLLPQLLAIFVFVGILLTLVSPELISSLLGQDSGWFGMVLASLIGSVTLMPGFVAFPLASNLLSNGAGVTQMAVFVSTLMMVGIATFPLEMKYFGKKVAIARNVLAFLFSFVVALVIGGFAA